MNERTTALTFALAAQIWVKILNLEKESLLLTICLPELGAEWGNTRSALSMEADQGGALQVTATA